MKISQSTIDTLKNFGDINPSLFISEGSRLKTRAVAGNIHAEATVEEEFPVSFGVWDLNSLIAMITLFDDPEVSFGEHSLTINKDENEFEFYYANQEIVKPVTNEIPKYESLFECKLDSNAIQTIKKTSGILKAKAISFIGDGKEVFLSVGDHTTSTKNTYRKLLGESENVFSFNLDISVFKVVTDDYTVNVTSRKFVHFASDSKDLDYVLAVLGDSYIGK